MIHVRAVSPSEITPKLLHGLEANAGVLNLVVIPGAARHPDGDAVQFDVITAEANRVLARLRSLEIDRRGSISSVVVAVLAGIVGVVSLAESRINTLIGVFVSVTTIPAAADIGVSTAFGRFNEASGSIEQLLLNLVLLIVVGAVTLELTRRFWLRRSQRAGAR